MESIQFSILIYADRIKVWNTMLEDETYRKWTKAFHSSSYYEGNWNQGSEILFLAPNDEGKAEGMYSRIKENIKHEFISIEHLGIISRGAIDTSSDEVKKWTPSLENYTLTDLGNKTELKIELQVPEDYKRMFEEMWLVALNALKSLCEQ